MTRGLGGHSPANVAFYLKGIDFPADKQELIDYAYDSGAESEVLDELEQLPGGDYFNMADVMKGYGEERRQGSYGNRGRGSNFRRGNQSYNRGNRSPGRSEYRRFSRYEDA